MLNSNLNDVESLKLFSEETKKVGGSGCNKLGLDSENVEQGLAKLVLTVVELLRKLLESQAMTRIENGTVTDEEAEKMGETFYKLEAKMVELREVFNLKEEDLNIDLGPLGNLF